MHGWTDGQMGGVQSDQYTYMPSRIIPYIQVVDETVKDPVVKVKENTDSALSRLSSISKQKSRKKVWTT